MTEDDKERITRLEEKYITLEKAVCKLQESREEDRKEMQESQLDMKGIATNLQNLTLALAEHNKAHEKKEEKGFSLSNIIIAAGMLVMAIAQIWIAQQTLSLMKAEKHDTTVAIERRAEK